MISVKRLSGERNTYLVEDILYLVKEILKLIFFWWMISGKLLTVKKHLSRGRYPLSGGKYPLIHNSSDSSQNIYLFIYLKP